MKQHAIANPIDTVAKRSGSVLPGGGFNKWLSLSLGASRACGVRKQREGEGVAEAVLLRRRYAVMKEAARARRR